MARCPQDRRNWPLLAGRVLGLSFLLLLLFLTGSLCAIRNGSDDTEPRATRAKTDVRTIAAATRLFTLRHRRLPVLAELSKSFGGSGPALESVPRDPWDHDYVLRATGSRPLAFEVVSAGPDGVLDTEDDIRARGDR
jgi:hypothetical protein